MNKRLKIARVLFLISLSNLCTFAWAEEATINLLANRPQVEYTAADLRDPFKSCIPVNRVINPQLAGDTDGLQDKISSLKVEGIIWGTRMPQAIINDNLYNVGDKIENAEITSIDKNGVNLKIGSGVVTLLAPGQQKNNSKDSLKEAH